MLSPTTALSIGVGIPLTLIGRSRAGDGTAWAIPELKWMFDAGAVVASFKPTTVFLSHTHADHVLVLPRLLTEQPGGSSKPTTVYLPSRAKPFVEEYMRAHSAMTGMEEAPEAPVGYQLVAVDPGTCFTLSEKGREFVVRILQCDHRIDCIGFSIVELKKQRKPQYEGLAGPEIGQLARSGVQIHDKVEVPVVCVLGDTTHSVFDNHPEILELHKTIVVECSFLDDGRIGRADETRHMHWSRLKSIVDAHPETLFVLTHFSLVYKAVDIRKFFCDACAESRNVHPMIVQDEVEEAWRKAASEGPAPVCNCFSCRPRM